MRLLITPLIASLLYACSCSGLAADNASLQQQVMETEKAFAKTMADRDFAAFGQFISDEAVFQGAKVLRGRAAVLAGWKRLYEKPTAPFSWAPESVEVLDSGNLALSRGPVFDPSGRQVGRFNSVWRREASGSWRIVFDFGSDEVKE
ncbi:DUF4440 domain-containing protein [Chitinimonas sp.]|uniref:YybH family protein n=1 Tax=Chitinimonas sp. TaxID=1934313 RepID=UPI0035AF10AE